MRVDVLQGPSVTGPGGTVGGSRLGGRRAHVVLVALALEGPLSAERLADLVWHGQPPPTWPVALRGVVRGIRAAARAVGLDDRALLETAPGGYRLGSRVTVDVLEAEAVLDRAQEAIRSGQPRAARELVEPLTRWRGADLLPDEDGKWLDVPRQRVDTVARRAWELTVEAAAADGDHRLAVRAAEQWVAAAPLDERAHRALIAALDAAHDRAGALRAFEACRRMLADELGVDPTRETVEVYLRALGDQHAPTHADVPRPATTFHGRAEEVRRLATRLSRPGLVTVVGPAGVGKSRLAAEAMGRAGPDRPVRWVPLEAVAEEELVAATVGMTLGVPPGDDAAAAVVAELAPSGPLVLVLDGAEAALDGVATLAERLVGDCPQLTVVVTSRIPLGLVDEEVLSLAPWTVPEPDLVDPAALARDHALELLLARAGDEVGALDRADPAVLASLLRHCGGIPLAIELVAAQLSTMAPGDLADRLDELVRGDADPVREVAASSYALLSQEEAAVFRRFAVLDGEVGLSLATQVLAGEPVPGPRVVRILGQLAAWGLLRVDRGAERSRWSQDDELHRFARELLTGDEEPATYARLAAAVRALLPDDPRAAPGGYADRVTAMLPSVRSLLTAAVDGRADGAFGLELAFRLHRYWAVTSLGEGRFWLARLLDATDVGTTWRPYATYALGYLEYWAGDSDQAIPRLRSAAELLTGVDDEYVARTLVFLAGLLDDTDHPAEAVAVIREAIGIAEAFGPELRMPTVMGLGSLLSERGDPEAAEHAARAIAICRDSGDADQLRMALPTAAMISWMVGADEDARAYVAEAMPLHDAAPRIAKVVLYSAAAGLALADGDAVRAAELAARADADGTELGVERELPLARAISARALLGLGDLRGAADRAAAAIEAATTIAYDFPLAIGLETAALVARTAGTGTPDQLAALVHAAAELRRRGDRPPPATMPAPRLDAPSEPLDARDAARLAVKLLADL